MGMIAVMLLMLILSVFTQSIRDILAKTAASLVWMLTGDTPVLLIPRHVLTWFLTDRAKTTISSNSCIKLYKYTCSTADRKELPITGSFSSRRKLSDGHDCCFKSCWHQLRRNSEHSEVRLHHLLPWDSLLESQCVNVNSEPVGFPGMLTGPNRSAATLWSTRIPMPSWSGSWRLRWSDWGTCCSLRVCRSCWTTPVCHTYTWDHLTLRCPHSPVFSVLAPVNYERVVYHVVYLS